MLHEHHHELATFEKQYFSPFLGVAGWVPQHAAWFVISLIVRTSWQVREVASYALSESQPPTTLGDPQNIEKTIWNKFDFFWCWKSFFHPFSWILEELDNFRYQNQLPHEILLQMYRFSAPGDL